MKTRKLHRLIGLVMVLPFIAWAITGMIFFIKPGYGDAYAPLPVKTYPLDGWQPQSQPQWLEIRAMRTVLGNHLLVKTKEGNLHLNEALEPWPMPDTDSLKTLVEDAVEGRDRYGAVLRVEDTMAHTETGCRISINWQGMSLYQQGRDTDRIDLIYKIHYLQWTGNKALDQVLGGIGLCFLIVMTVTGIYLAFGRSRSGGN